MDIHTFCGLEKLQCIALTLQSKQCRKKISPSQRQQALRMIQQLGMSGFPDDSLLESILSSLMCGTHASRAEAQVKSLAQKFGTKLCKYATARTQDPLSSPSLIESRPCTRNSATTFEEKLRSKIDTNQFIEGYIYGFTSPTTEGFIKIGCSKDLPESRIRQWRKCYPDAWEVIREQFLFPQRMEELLHLYFKAYRVEMKCNTTTCKTEWHDEWFECGEDKIRATINRWKDLTNVEALYHVKTRKLALQWEVTHERLCKDLAEESSYSNQLPSPRESLHNDATAINEGMKELSIQASVLSSNCTSAERRSL